MLVKFENLVGIAAAAE